MYLTNIQEGDYHPLTDTEIISDGKYRQDENYFSNVLPLGTSAAQPENLATVYRWELTDSDGHWLGTDPNDAPPNQKASEGAKFTALAAAPQDPFSISTESGPRKLTGKPPAGDAARPGAPEYIPVTYSTPAQNFLNELGSQPDCWGYKISIQLSINDFVEQDPAFTRFADRYPNDKCTKTIPFLPSQSGGYASSCEAYATGVKKISSGVYMATGVEVVSFSG